MSGALQDWKSQKKPFAAVVTAPVFWLALFFVAPMAIVWLYSFGQNAGPADIEISGTLDNYKRATEWLYVSIFLKSFAVAALTTLLCLIIGFPVAMAITFAAPKWRPWLLLGIMLPFWTNLLIRTYALMALMGTNGYMNKGLAGLWEGASWLRTLVGMQPLDAWTPVQLLYNNFAVVLGLVYVHLPFMVLPLYSALDRLDKSLIEASLDLGAGHFKTFMQIVVPLAEAAAAGLGSGPAMSAGGATAGATAGAVALSVLGEIASGSDNGTPHRDCDTRSTLQSYRGPTDRGNTRAASPDCV